MMPVRNSLNESQDFNHLERFERLELFERVIESVRPDEPEVNCN
jgi:hypothetical protein